jgi:hypothetical protein
MVFGSNEAELNGKVKDNQTILTVPSVNKLLLM